MSKNKDLPSELLTQEKEQLMNAVHEQIIHDMESKDTTVLFELLGHVPFKVLLQSLPEERWAEFENKHMLQFPLDTEEIARGREAEILKGWVNDIHHLDARRPKDIDDVFGGYNSEYEILVLSIYMPHLTDKEKYELSVLREVGGMVFRTDFGDCEDFEFWGTNSLKQLEVIDAWIKSLHGDHYSFSWYLSDSGQKIYNAYKTLKNLIG